MKRIEYSITFTLEKGGMDIFKKIRWKFLKPGQVIVEDIRINDETIPELSDFPVLMHELLNLITGKYRFNPDRVVTVVDSRFQIRWKPGNCQYERGDSASADGML